MVYLLQFFSANYWFGFPPFITTPALMVLLILFTLFLCIGVAALVSYPRIENRWHRSIARRGASGAVWIGVLGLLFTFTRYERVPIFMSRYWLFVVGVGVVVWAVRLKRYARERRDTLEEETRVYRSKEKYLPH